MGQAKKRGTFEERKAQSIEKETQLLAALEESAKVWYESLTDEDKERYAKLAEERKARMAKASTALGAIGAGVLGHF